MQYDIIIKWFTWSSLYMSRPMPVYEVIRNYKPDSFNHLFCQLAWRGRTQHNGGTVYRCVCSRYCTNITCISCCKPDTTCVAFVFTYNDNKINCILIVAKCMWIEITNLLYIIHLFKMLIIYWGCDNIVGMRRCNRQCMFWIVSYLGQRAAFNIGRSTLFHT